MKSSHRLPPERAIFAPPNQTTGSCIASNPVGPEQPPPFHGIEFQPSKLCPRNFIIFDQTDFQSRVMFNPAIAPKFAPADVQTRPTYVENSSHAEDREVSTPNQEDSDEINALLSLDNDDDYDYDDGDCEEYDDEEEMSTARTNGNYGCRSPDSCSNYGGQKQLNPKFSISCLLPNSNRCGSSNCSSSGTKKNQKVKKMVKALRGIVPGGQRMSTVTLLDEAVKYLKSLKGEAQKIGGGDMKKN